jgi:hypothetical protein
MFSRITQMNFAFMDTLFAQNWSTDPSYILSHFSKCRVLNTPVYFYILYFLPIILYFFPITLSISLTVMPIHIRHLL